LESIEVVHIVLRTLFHLSGLICTVALVVILVLGLENVQEVPKSFTEPPTIIASCMESAADK